MLDSDEKGLELGGIGRLQVTGIGGTEGGTLVVSSSAFGSLSAESGNRLVLRNLPGRNSDHYSVRARNIAEQSALSLTRKESARTLLSEIGENL